MSIYTIPAEATHLAVVIMEFEEGESEQTLIGAGTFEECDTIARTLPAVTYSGDRKTKTANVSVFPVPLFPPARAARLVEVINTEPVSP